MVEIFRMTGFGKDDVQIDHKLGNGNGKIPAEKGYAPDPKLQRTSDSDFSFGTADELKTKV